MSAALFYLINLRSWDMRKYSSNSPKNCTEKNSKILQGFNLINSIQQTRHPAKSHRCLTKKIKFKKLYPDFELEKGDS